MITQLLREHRSALLAALGVAILFLFPVTVFVESDPLVPREESNILETIENFVDMIDTTTMTPRLTLHNEDSMLLTKYFRAFDAK